LAAATASRHLLDTGTKINRSVERLSTGYRVNRAGDDAAGLVISEQLRAQTSGLRQAARNAQDGISMLQTTEGALEQVNRVLNRARDLSVAAANSGASSLTARQASQLEMTQLLSELDRVSTATTFGSLSLLNGSIGKTNARMLGSLTGSSATVTFGSLTVSFGGSMSGSVNTGVAPGTYTGEQLAAATQQAIRGAMGSSASSVIRDAANSFTVTATAKSGGGWTLVMEAGGLPAGATFALAGTGTWGTPPELGFAAQTSTAAADTGVLFQTGANAGETVAVSTSTFSDTSSKGLGLTGLNIAGGDTAAAQAISSLDSAIATVSARRGAIGAMQGRFESMIESLQTTTENSTAAESRIRDTDMAAEMVELTKSQVLSQVGSAMLAQANRIQEGVLLLLRA
jgi:flagellin